MPNLRSISVIARRRVVHGLSQATVKLLLSLPQVQEVSIIGLLLCPSKARLPDDDYHLDSFAPVTSFRYEAFSNRFNGMNTRHDYPFPSEEELLLHVLSNIHTSLEKLVLSAEPAPLLAMSQWHWPKLRELRLRGERRSNPPVPYMTLLSAMPNLRTLFLELTLVSEECTHTEPLWPPGSRMPFPWPDLTQLSIAHPHPTDELYRHLPPSVRALSLCCRPHKSERAWIRWHLIYTVPDYEYPVLTPSQVLGILSVCQLPGLMRLEIEYEAVEEESDLLRSLAVLFPRLAWLQIHRYRVPGRHDGDLESVTPRDDELGFVDSIGRGLSQLSQLHTLCVYLHLPHQPAIRDIAPHYSQAEIDEYTEILRAAAHILARAIRSLEIVYLWRPRESGRIEWAPFEVARGGRERTLVDDVEIRCPDARKYGGPRYPTVPLHGEYAGDF